MKTTHAITRAVGAALPDCALTFVDRAPIDLAKAHAQHAAYRESLRRAGAIVEVLPADDGLADSVFVEDTAVVLDEAAVVTRPGAPLRQREAPAITAALSAYRKLLPIVRPATLEGGDVLRLDRDFFVGISSRTNEEGLSQFASIVGAFGYRATPIEVKGCLHLKTAVTALDAETLLVNPSWIDAAALPRVRKLVVPPDEPFGANALVVNGVVHLSARWKRTRELVEESGFSVTSLDVSEFEKAEAGLTCLSLIFST
ncbi:MAG TPA: arginine deiminase family protein [Thermoanaerobaculia bacterium]|nr:arginine deiminase family protein [Thermoanaerobaculia bacterium]